MRKGRYFLNRLPLYLLWALFSAVLWIFVLARVMDAPEEKKLSLFLDVSEAETDALADAAEKLAPTGIRRVTARLFSYAMMSGSELSKADIYLIREENMDAYAENLGDASAFSAAHPDWEAYVFDGRILGVKVYDAATGTGFLQGYITYSLPGEKGQDVYLCFGAASGHTGGADGDTAAFALMESLLAAEGS